MNIMDSAQKHPVFSVVVIFLTGLSAVIPIDYFWGWERVRLDNQ